MALPVRLSVLRALFKELSVDGGAPLAVGGARELAAVLRRDLGRGAAPGAVRADDTPEGAAAYVYVATGGEDDEAALKRARHARVPVVAVTSADDVELPFVLATDVVPVLPGHGFPLEEIAARVAARLGEDGAPLAARVPALRGAVADELVRSFARKNAIVAAARKMSRALSRWGSRLNWRKSILKMIKPSGGLPPRQRVPEIAATLAAGFGLRALARELLDLVPVAGWAVQSGVAYAGTRALGEAAIKRLDVVRPGGH